MSRRKHPLPTVVFNHLGEPYLSYDHPNRETKEFVTCLNAWRSAQRNEMNRVTLDIASMKRQLEEIANPIRPVPAPTTKTEWVGTGSVFGDIQVTVAKMLKRSGIHLAYENRFLATRDERVLCSPTDEEVEAWNTFMKLANDE